jgi:hypothetical protein
LTSHSPVGEGEDGAAGCECAAPPITSENKAAARIGDDVRVAKSALFVTCETPAFATMGFLTPEKWLKSRLVPVLLRISFGNCGLSYWP